MPGIPFIKDFKFDYGTAMEVTPLIRRVVANNPNPFTFKGTGTYIIGHARWRWSIRARTSRTMSTPCCGRCAARP